MIEYPNPHCCTIEGEYSDMSDQQQANMHCENAYRRGFHQGIFSVMEWFSSNATESELARYEQAIFRWRYRRHKGKPERPPRLGVSA